MSKKCSDPAEYFSSQLAFIRILLHRFNIMFMQKAYLFMNVVQLLVSFGGVSQKVIVESKEWYAAICFSAGRKYMEKLSRQKVQPFLSLFCNNDPSLPIIFIPLYLFLISKFQNSRMPLTQNYELSTFSTKCLKIIGHILDYNRQSIAR